MLLVRVHVSPKSTLSCDTVQLTFERHSYGTKYNSFERIEEILQLLEHEPPFPLWSCKCPVSRLSNRLENTNLDSRYSHSVQSSTDCQRMGGESTPVSRR